MNETEIKKCPFCGGNARVSTKEKLFLGWNGFGTKKIEYAAQVICNKCYARGGIVTGIFVKKDSQLKYDLEWLGERAIEAWNRRVHE